MIAMDREEVLAMLKAAKAHSPRAHAMVLVSIRHGLRCSEVTGLRLDQVNLKESWVRIERLKGSMTTIQPLERHPGQPILDEVRILGAWLRARQDDGSNIVFNSSHGGRMNRSTFFRLWRTVATHAGLPEAKRHPHIGKFTCGSLLAERGANMAAIRQHLGHRSISSSAVYAQVSEAQAAAVARQAFMATF